MRDRAHVAAVLVADQVQDEALAVVEAEPHRPVLPAQLVAIQRERGAIRLADLERLDVVAQLQAGDELRRVLAHHRRRRGVGGMPIVLELEQLHRVEVDDRVQARERVGVWIAVGRGAMPDVGPADPPVRVLRRRDRRAVGPYVDQHQIHIGHAALGERLDHRRVPAQHLVGLVVIGDGHRRVLAGRELGPRRDAVLGQRDRALEPAAVLTVPADDLGHARRRRVRGQLVLAGLVQVDHREPPAVGRRVLASHRRGRGADLLRRERIERMRSGGHCGGILCADDARGRRRRQRPVSAGPQRAVSGSSADSESTRAASSAAGTGATASGSP